MPTLSENDRLQFRERLIWAADCLELEMNNQQGEQLLDYLTLLAKWNSAFNLTAVRDPRDMLDRHLIDSLSVVSYIKGDRILDVGTGPGLPGIPMSILLPAKQFVLLDTNSKKTRFLTQCQIELGLENIEVINARVEDCEFAEPFDQIVSRAFTALGNMVSLCAKHLSQHGEFLAMKGQLLKEEFSELPADYPVKSTLELEVPGCTGQRHLIIIAPSGEGLSGS